MKQDSYTDITDHHLPVKDEEIVNTPRTLTPLAARSLIIGSIFGVGAFVVSGRILQAVGSPGMMMIIWVIAGLLVLCGGLAYSELGLMLPQSGGDIPYLDAAFRFPPRLFSFLYCWARVVLIHPAALACFCVLATNYIFAAVEYPNNTSYDPYSLEDFKRKSVAITLLLASLLSVSFSNVLATRSAIFFTFLKIAIVLFIFISMIVYQVRIGISNPNLPRRAIHEHFAGTSADFGSYANALVQALFAFEGFANLSMVLGELKNPETTVKSIILSSIFGVFLLYMSINTMYILVLSKDLILKAGSLLPLVFAQTAYNHIGAAYFMASLVMLSALGVSVCVFYGAARVCQYSAEVGLFPFASFFKKTHPKFGTPFPALMFTAFLAFLFILVPPGGGSFFMLVTIATYSTWIFYVLTMSGLLLLRYQQPDLPRPYKVPHVCPMVVIQVGLFVLIVQFLDPENRLACAIGLGVFVLGVPIYYFFIYRYLHKE